MKKLIYLLILSCLIISCGKKNKIDQIHENQMNETFLAGNYSGENIYYTLVEDIHINITRTDSSAYKYGISPLIDLKNDFIQDLFLNVISIGVVDDYSTSCYFNTLDNIEICLAENDTSNIKLLQKGDTISSDGNWQGTLDKNYFLASCYFRSQNSIITTDSTTGQWNDVLDGYMAIRTINDNDTTYGWIQIDLTGRYDLIINSYAIQK